MQIMMVLALMQAPAKPDSLQFATIHNKPLNDTLTLWLEAAEHRADNGLHSQLRVSVIDRRRPKERRLITVIRDQNLNSYEVLRTDDTTVVVSRHGHYESRETLKLFLHRHTKSVIKQIDYAPDLGLRAVDDREVARVLEVPPQILQLLGQKPWARVYDSTHMPMELRTHPMPQSTYDDFVRARPGVEDGHSRATTRLEEQPGPYQVVGSRIWFGKVFYDGEGISGVGGLGYFETSTSQYRFVQVPGLTDWSVSAILIEPDAAWIGLVDYPEGESYAGGLIRYDFKSRTSRKFATEEVIHQLVRWQDRLYVATRNGAYLVQGGRLAKRYRVEPNIDNRFILVTEDLSSRP